MRLSENQIKEAILHPDPELRDRAISYFSKSFSPDPEIMPLVIKAIETHGRHDAYGHIGQARDLRQSEDTVAWVIHELNDEQNGQDANYPYNLSMVLVQADPALLLPRETAILEARHFYPDLRPAFIERLRMRSWDWAACWQKLEGFCEENKAVQDINEVDLGHARRIVEALARFGPENTEKVRTVLSQHVENYHDHPLAWLEPLAVRLAGQAQLESVLPLLISKLREDGGDLLNEECAEALTRIGTPAVLHAIAETFPTAIDSFRLYATGPLELIHSDLAVEKCLDLFARETDRGIRLNLAQALLGQFAREGIEVARQLLLGQKLDFESRGLRQLLLETCAFMGERFPEYDEWLATANAERAEHRRRVKELEGDPERLMLYALEILAGKKPTDTVAARPPVPPMPVQRPALESRPEGKAKVGRNAPCPCGSGKKFKNCCLNR
jgi:hypothetical protein